MNSRRLTASASHASSITSSAPRATYFSACRTTSSAHNQSQTSEPPSTAPSRWSYMAPLASSVSSDLVDAPGLGLQPSEQGARSPQRSATSRPWTPNHSFDSRERVLLLRVRASAEVH
jgi:hypothetical protein